MAIASGNYRGFFFGSMPNRYILSQIWRYISEVCILRVSEEMDDDLTAEDKKMLERWLNERGEALEALISHGVSNSDQQNYEDLNGGVGDQADASLVDQLADQALMDVNRHMDELNNVRQAQQRMREGSYGLCIDCGNVINPARLHANPIALRCLICQEKWELEHNVQSPRL
jgi:RNA polymerase-binding transcription factor DksA